MRLIVLAAGAVLLSAATAHATPIEYLFVGTLPFGSALIQGDGTVTDLSSAAFTATGVTVNDMQPSTLSIWDSTTLYDFGALGSFQTSAGTDNLVVFRGSDPRFMSVELISWTLGTLEDLGFSVYMQVPDGFDVLSPSLNAVTPISASASGYREQTNVAGQLFIQSGPPTIGWPMTISEVTLTPVPEPTTLVLAVIGVTLGWRGRHQMRRH